jgi:putative ABC transport system substrate-binding protein
MRRREFITLLSGAAAASPLLWPLAARAQHSAMPVIGFLNPGSSEPYAHLVAAFGRGLKETGYVEGQNVSIEYRWANGQYDRLSAMADDLVSRRVTVIAATGGVFSGLAAKKATSTIPIVFIGTGDPVAFGLVASLNRPGGNVTGVTMLGNELLAKRLELLGELVPNFRMIGVLVNTTNPSAKVQVSNVEEAARLLGRQIAILNATSEDELNTAFAGLIQQQIPALLITEDTFFVSQSNQLAALTVRYAIPAIHNLREFAGGLMSYGTNFANAYRQVGIYVGRILKGAMPADLPVEQSTRFDLVINLTTAKALGLNIPDKLLALADEVVE